MQNSLYFSLLALVTCILAAAAQDPQTGGSAQTPRLLEPPSDGTPAPPPPPKPGFIASSSGILESHTLPQGGRSITLQNIVPLPLPSPPEKSEDPIDSPALQERLAEFRRNRPELRFLSVSATVHHFPDAPPRSQVTLSFTGDSKPVNFWSSADFSLLTGFSSYLGTDGATRHFMLTWSVMDIGKLAEALHRRGRPYQMPDIPPLPDGKATFAITSPDPSPEMVAEIEALHDLYNQHLSALQAAYEVREKARIAQEAELKAHPPQPKNLTLNYWNLEQPAQRAPANGGVR